MLNLEFSCGPSMREGGGGDIRTTGIFFRMWSKELLLDRT
jgi:hypothetical protein